MKFFIPWYKCFLFFEKTIETTNNHEDNLEEYVEETNNNKTNDYKYVYALLILIKIYTDNHQVSSSR